MIQSKHILFCLRDLKEDLEVKKFYGKSTAISINPSSLSRALLDLKRDIRNPLFREEPVLKFLYYYGQQDMIVWCAYRATHSNLLSVYGLRDRWFGAFDLDDKSYSVNGSGLWNLDRDEYFQGFFRGFRRVGDRIERVPEAPGF